MKSLNIFIFALVIGAIAARQTNNLRPKLEGLFNHLKIELPQNIEMININHDGLEIETGMDYTKAQTVNEPSVSLSDNSIINRDSSYVFIMLDLDDPVTGSLSWIHWVQAGYPEDKKPETYFKYQSPGPPAAGGPHRYAYFFLEKTNGDDLQIQDSRGLFEFSDFIKNNNLKMVAANYYTVTYTMHQAMESVFNHLNIENPADLAKITVRHGDLNVKTGADYTKPQTVNEPTIEISDDSIMNRDSSYVFIMLDLDDPVTGSLSWIHWVQAGYPEDKEPMTYFKYQSPGPPAAGGPHRYAYFLLEKTNGDDLQIQNSRGLFEFSDFIKNNNLKMVAANYYTVTYTMHQAMESVFNHLNIENPTDLAKIIVKHGDLNVKTGADYTKAQTVNEPSIQISDYSIMKLDASYVFIMLDLDDPVTGSLSWIHWVQAGHIEDKKPMANFKYQSPGPPLGGGPHRYAYFLLEQTNGNDIQIQDSRGLFEFSDFIKNNNLKMIASNYYTVTFKNE